MVFIWRKERAVRLIDADALKEWIDEFDEQQELENK